MLLRFGLLLVLGLLPCSVGCFRGLAYPEFPSCPGTTLPAVTDEVFAVRIEVSHERSGPTLTAANQTERHTATRIDVADGKVPAQRSLTLSYWRVAGAGDTPACESRSHAVMVKIYRRGYRTLIIRPNDGAVPCDWSPDPRPDDQLAAIRAFAYETQQPPAPPKLIPGQPNPALLPPVPGQAPPVLTPRAALSPGSVGEHHKKVLLFIAAEFDRVADLYPVGSPAAATCRKEADDVRALAAR